MDLITQGTYAGRVRVNDSIQDVGMDKSSKGTPLLDVVIALTHVLDGEAWRDVTPFDRHLRIYLSDAAMDTAKEKLETIGFNGDFLIPQIDGDKWIQLACTHEDYKGKLYEKWELANWGGSKERQAPTADVLRKLNARYSSVPKAQPVALNSEPPGPSDDIPF